MIEEPYAPHVRCHRERVALLRAHDLQLTMSDIYNMKDVQYYVLHWFGQWIYMVLIDSHIGKIFYLQVILTPDTNTNSLFNNST